MLIEISTNGSGGRSGIWERLGKLPNVQIGFALDGLEDTHKLYRKNTSWTSVINNAKKFISAGGKAVWRMIKFDHNMHQLEACERMSKELGFYGFSISYDGRDNGPVYDRHGNYSYKLGNDPLFSTTSYPSNVITWKEWTNVGDKTENKLKQYATIPIKSDVNCFSIQNREIYITVTGEVYPCCWLGFYPKLEYKHAWQRDNMFLKDMAVNNNAFEVGIERAIEWFNSIEESWNKKAYTEGRLFKCDEYCGKN